MGMARGGRVGLQARWDGPTSGIITKPPSRTRKCVQMIDWALLGHPISENDSHAKSGT